MDQGVGRRALEILGNREVHPEAVDAPFPMRVAAQYQPLLVRLILFFVTFIYTRIRKTFTTITKKEISLLTLERKAIKIK